ncbi:unnamed protein product [Calicophoron daubneyi]|uniref:ABC-type glutathione-S-conjugate transporter n=1 Tax=Calicophoron daubneyi TaxID=300641 RepID=A0AAV2TEG5_CALDB
MYWILLHYERLRDAANSGICFFLLVISTLVVGARCWNYLMAHLLFAPVPQAVSRTGSVNVSQYFKTVAQSTDLGGFAMCLLLLVLQCNSERMIQYKCEGQERKFEPQRQNRSLLHYLRKNSAKIDSKGAVELEQSLTQKADKPVKTQLFSPERYASFLSRVFYYWFTSLIIRGYRKSLQITDLWKLEERHQAVHVAEQFYKNLDVYVIPKKSINYYKERRRISLQSGIWDSANSCVRRNSALEFRRRSAQSALGIGRSLNGSNAYVTGYAGHDDFLTNRVRRASEGTTIQKGENDGISSFSPRRLSLRQRSSFKQSLQTQHEEVNVSSETSSLKKTGSASVPDKMVDESPRQTKTEENNNAQAKQERALPPVGILGCRRDPSLRRSVRIKVGSKPALVPGVSESRSESVTTQPTDDQVTTWIESLDNKCTTANRNETSLPPKETSNDSHGKTVQVDAHKNVTVQEKGKLESLAFSDKGDKAQEAEGNSRKSATEKQSDKGHPMGLLRAVIVTYWRPLLWSSILKLAHDILVFANPTLLKFLLRYLQHGQSEPAWHGYFYAISMVLVAGSQTLILQRYFRDVNFIGMHMRTAISSAVYRKSLYLSNTARRESTTGQIINLMSSDAQQFTYLMPYVNILWSGPFQIVVAVVLLWDELGPSVLAGIAVLLLLLPLNIFVARKSKSVQEKKSQIADTRIKTISELLNGIRVIKLYAWEPSFMKVINRQRDQEMVYLRRFTYLHAISFLWNCAPFLVAICSFGVYVMVSEENVLDAQRAFVSLSLFNILRFPLFMFPMVTSSLVQAYVSIKRLEKFLRRTEINTDSFSWEDTPGISAVIERGVFGWDPEGEPVLNNVTIHFPEGQLTSVMGTVGSGKSSLLHALLGDMERFNGRVNVKGSVAYVPQQPWIYNATLRDNILFLRPYDPARYKKVIDACCLTPDLEILPNGDLTEIGDKGINLSGGQKQRVSLARACYADADLYLLDDPLSAVDAHVGLQLLNQVLSRSTGLLASKTCILTTHSPKALPFSDRVALLEDGYISELGTYRQLLNSRNSRLTAFLAECFISDQENKSRSRVPVYSSPSSKELGTDSSNKNRKALESTTCSENAAAPKDTETVGGSPSIHLNSTRSTASPASHSVRKHTASTSSDLTPQDEASFLFDSLIAVDDKDEEDKEASQATTKAPEKKPPADNSCLIQPETSLTGRVKLSVFKTYLRNVGLFYCVLILILFPVSNLASLGTNLWLAAWSDDAKSQSNLTARLRANPAVIRNASSDPALARELSAYYSIRDYRLGVYGAIGLLQVLSSMGSMFVFAVGHLSCAQKLHTYLLAGILHAPAGFFDIVPQGRIVNRFAQDIATLDGPLLFSMRSCLNTFLHCSLTLIMACTVNPWITIPIIVLTVIYMFLQNVYVANSRQLKRIESVSRSPIFSHFSETLLGVDSIRAYGLTEKYKQLNADKLDTNNSAVYAGLLAQRWLAVLLESVGNMVIISVALFAVSSRDRLTAGFSGLVISYALNLNQSLNWFVRMTADLESNIVCVERIDEYSKVTQEAPWEVDEYKPPPNWPEGEIEFANYGTRYRENLNLVLSAINVKVNKGERIGIVGRTGSGKSSLVMALFRMLEASEGKITIDGRDIAFLGLHDLRNRLTLIPQDPVLFSGTLRFNLDPFEQHTDAEVWAALELANLKSYVTETSNGSGLDMVVAEGGSNMSMGQRQLLCLARALLRRTAILVLDEATAAVDPITDNHIQETIRLEFPKCTVLTIAHRLNTVLDYDRVMVLDNGKLVELGSPKELLKNTKSVFYLLAKDARLVD